MFTVFAIIVDELGTRSVPTGEGSINYNIAANQMLRRMIQEPLIEFFVEFIPSEDYYNAFNS